jgi:XTP/dITP diphosphohydrolase
MKVLLATNNPDKAAELQHALDGLPGVTVLLPADVDQPLPDPVEDGERLEENAYIKARTIHEATGLPVIADDTGLEVESLDGAPGVLSARFSGPDATYESNCDLLLSRMKKKKDRSARFRTVTCYVDSLRTLMAEGVVEGTIAKKPQGKGGFGYDPLFIPDGHEKSFAAMPVDEKNAISHRGRAVRALHELLEHYLEPNGVEAG